jgi:uncharacterized protein (TIGR02996 family)
MSSHRAGMMNFRPITDPPRDRDMTPSHPEADAFVRGILADPTDRVRRLVFSDWLEEQGGKSNAAWANYIRLRAEAETLSPDDPEWSRLLVRAESYHPAIRARLTLPVGAVRFRFLHFSLLPPARVRIRLDETACPRAIAELVPESVARENSVIPIGLEGKALAFATPYPRNRDLGQKLSFILNKDIVLFFSPKGEVEQAINRSYGEIEYECFDSSLFLFPVIDIRDSL